MFQRGFTPLEVTAVADMGLAIEDYPDDTPYPSKLILGWIDARPVYLVLANNVPENVHVVVAIYEPDASRWGPDFVGRKS
jgi:hypothetical protein